MPALKRKWSPHPAQRAIMDSPARFRVVAAGRRFGKTEMARHLAIEQAWENSNANVWWVSPRYEDANELGFDELEQELPEAAIETKSRSHPRKIKLINGSVLSFRSGDREDSLRGRGLDFLVIDEAASVPSRAWRSELRPALSDYEAPMVAIGTPKGQTGWFHEWFERGQGDEHPETVSWQATTYDNPYIADSEVEAARAELPQFVFEQEYLAKFRSPSGLVYQEFTDDDIVADDPANPRRVLYGVDWGYANPAAITVVIETRTDEFYVVDEFYEARQTAQDIAAAAAALQDRWGAGTFFCDPAEPDSIEEFGRAGLDATDADNSLMPGIGSVASAFSADRLFIHERCENLIREMNNYRYPETDEEDEPPEKPIAINDHAADSLRYAIHTGDRHRPNIGVLSDDGLW